MSKIVDRTLDLFELFAREKRPLSLSEIAQLLNIPMSSCHDVVHAMQARGYLYEIAPRAGYYPTSRLFFIGKEAADNDPVAIRATALLLPLRDKLDESVLLAKVNGLNATYLVVLEPISPLYVRVKVGDSIRSIHGTSAGKAILGSLPHADFESFLKKAKLDRFTVNTITSASALRREIESSRARGWYLNREETLSGVTTMSTSFRYYTTKYIITIAAPSSRFDGKLEEAAGLLMGVSRLLDVAPAIV